VPAVTELYAAHVATRQAKAEAALVAAGYEAMLLHAGVPFTYFADDQDAPFKPTPHFAHWVPMAGPHHLLLVRPGAKPALVRVAPEDYWYEQQPLGGPFWAGEFQLTEVGSADDAWAKLPRPGRTAYVGGAPASAQARGIAERDCNPSSLVARLDWDRSHKTPYEVACLEEATQRAARGHAAAKQAFQAGASELEIHHAYVAAVRCVDHELPYGTIVALDEKGATLHYEGKREKRGGKVLLIDAGASHLGYGSDITRTWTTSAADEDFRELVTRLDAIQRELCDAVKPGVKYLALHEIAHKKIGELLGSLGVLKVGAAEAVAKNLTGAFFPHGLGHFLGIQVHDVSGRQKSPEGGVVAPPPRYPYLRTTRTIEVDQVFTIEPGVYFIEMLLRRHRNGPDRAAFHWPLIDRLMACGGVRIEDNVVVTKDGHRNLTRPHV
jgi:Xaa-Pro dipeptidase